MEVRIGGDNSFDGLLEIHGLHIRTFGRAAQRPADGRRARF
jgi:hypothetical protein